MSDVPVVAEVKAEPVEPKAEPVVQPTAQKNDAKRRETNKTARKPRPKTAARKVAKKAPAKKTVRRKAFPYAKVAAMWERGKTLTEISKATGYFDGNSDDPSHRLRVALTAMHKGWRDAKGKVHRLPHRVKKSSLAASRRAGKKAAA